MIGLELFQLRNDRSDLALRSVIISGTRSESVLSEWPSSRLRMQLVSFHMVK